MIPEHSVVVVKLHSPKEQYWGLLKSITTMGVTVEGINIDSFEDWVRQVAREEEMSIGMMTMFFPQHRIEKVFVDEDMGIVRSFATQFREAVGMSVEEYVLGKGCDSPITH